MSIEAVLNIWKNTPRIFKNIKYWNVTSPKEGIYKPFPESIHPALTQGLYSLGIRNLYLHQFLAWRYIAHGKNVGLVTDTASGKSLCYNLPILNDILYSKNISALYLFPTKALARDQLEKIDQLNHMLENNCLISIKASAYDGDTSRHTRKQLRENSDIIISNPDMLHYGILPFHPQWKNFMSRLRYVVIDESHIYRGVFGSHMSNIIRRLKRVAKFYGTSIQFILTSATIGNPKEFFTKLIGSPVEIITNDGSPKNSRNFIIYNPPLKHEFLRIRESIKNESLRLSRILYQSGIQTIIFTRSRRFAEILLKEHKERYSGSISDSSIYRSGLLPSERRQIEKGLREKKINIVFSTNALELGIDIGDLSAVIIAGYPGTIASVLQMSGRAGRGKDTSMAVLVVGSSPLEQYISRNPDFIVNNSPENALINPNNLSILVHHLECALTELPFRDNEHFGDLSPEQLNTLLNYFVGNRLAIHRDNKYYWIGKNQPTSKISLRSASQNKYLLQIFKNNQNIVIGEIDEDSAFLFVHPGAIYLQGGNQYLVESLDSVEKVAYLRKSNAGYYTIPKVETSVQLISMIDSSDEIGCIKTLGDIMINNQVVGYKKVLWEGGQTIGNLDLEMPKNEYQTKGYWISISKRIEEELNDDGLWINSPINYGPNWNKQKLLALKRDNYTCQVCGKGHDGEIRLHVHHKVPFRSFLSYLEANKLKNLVTLCPVCHRRAESSVRIRSGLAGITHALRNLAPIFLMCDYQDIEAKVITNSEIGRQRPTIIFYERVPGGIGFSQRLYDLHQTILVNGYRLINTCGCNDGCPSCVGPGGEFGSGGKKEALAILAKMISESELN